MHPPAGEGLGLHEELRGDRTADPGRPKGHPKPYSTVLSNGTGGKQEGRAVTGSDGISFQENMTSPAFLEHLPADGKQQTNSSFCCVCMHSLCFMQQAVFISIHEFYLYPHTLLFPLPLVGSEHASVWGSAAHWASTTTHAENAQSSGRWACAQTGASSLLVARTLCRLEFNKQKIKAIYPSSSSTFVLQGAFCNTAPKYKGRT